MAELLAKLGEKFTDLTAGALAGRLELGETRTLIVASGALSDPEGPPGFAVATPGKTRGELVAKTLWDNRRTIADFVERGGMLVVFTGENGSRTPDGVKGPGPIFPAPAFLPAVTQTAIEGLSHGSRVVAVSGHPLVAGRHKLSARDLGAARGALYSGGCYGVYLGLAPVVAYDARGRYPIVLEGAAGRGRVLLIHLTPDRAFRSGSDDEKVSATMLMENLVRYARSAAAGEVPAPRAVDRSVRGTVFEDANANGVFDADERPLSALDVSDGSTLVRTDAQGRFYLPLDAYSEFVWVAADLATHRGPFWRRLGTGITPADIGLVPRVKPLTSSRIVHMVDTGALFNPTDTDDPEFAWMLGEVARITPAADALVITGDATTARLAGAARPGVSGADLSADSSGVALAKAETLRVFAGGRGAGDPVAERDAFARTFGPTAYLVKFGPVELAVSCPRLIEGRLPGRLVAPAAGRVAFEGAEFRWGDARGATPSFRPRGVTHPPTVTILDLAPGTPRAESRLLGLTGLLHGVHPALESVVSPGALHPTVIVGDTALGTEFPVKLEMAYVGKRNNVLEIMELALGEYRLRPVGRLTRAVEFTNPLSVIPGYHVLRLSAAAPDGKQWTRNMTFSVPAEPPPAPAFGAPWLMTGGAESRSGECPDKAGAGPPFYLAAATNVGSIAPGESPVVLSDVVFVPGASTGSFLSRSLGTSVEMPTFAGLPVPAARLDVPFVCHAQGRYELRVDHAALVTGPVLRFDFPAGERPDPASTHLVVGGDLLCAVDARGPAWGFKRARGAETLDGAYDVKAAAESLQWKVDLLPGCRRAATTATELFTGAECVELGSGRVRWSLGRYALRGRTVALSGRTVVVAGVTPSPPSRQIVACLDADTGRVLWEKTLAEVHALDDANTATPGISRGKVYIGSADGVMRALELSDGSETWAFPTGPSVLPLGPGKGDSSKKGTVPFSGRITSQAVVTEQAVFFGACDGRFYALDRRKGTLLWSYNLGLPVVSSPALSGNTLYVADWDGNLYAFTSFAVKKKK